MTAELVPASDEQRTPGRVGRNWKQTQLNRGDVGHGRYFALLVALALTAGCRPAPEPYVPGLGKIMTLTQMRHAKLWLAGEAANWPLAAYELEELREGMDDAVALHPSHKGAPVAELVPRFMSGPLAQLDAAVGRHDRAAFGVAFDALINGCNGCHGAMQFDFNVVTRPSDNAYTNQVFVPVTP